MTRATESGFTLIETLVALVVLAAALVVFYDFVSTSLNGARRLESAAIAYDRQTNALELATTLNPMEAPEGAVDLGGYRISWTSRLVGDLRRSSRYPVGQGIFDVALYRVTLAFSDNGRTPPIEVIRLGHHRTDVPELFPTGAN